MSFQPQASAAPLPPLKCLLVDDLDENLLALSALLRRDDVELLLARSGREALEFLLANDVALAFLDVQMPDMDGFELAELIRGSERTRHVPLIFVTAGTRDQHRLFKGYETGAVDFLYKPIEPQILRNKAEVFFELFRQKQLLARELEERSETLRLNEMFMAVLGHDLRNPLSAMVMSASLLERRAGDDSVRQVASRMLASGKRMSRMIDDMLDLARVRLAGGMALKRDVVDLGAVIQRVVHEHQTAWPGRQIDLELGGNVFGEVDADRCAQVVSNLIGNALQHGEPDEAIGVRFDGGAAGAMVVSVANAGSIPASVLPHVFDPFRRSEHASGRNDGLGLGLYIVQQIVQAHGGRVEVASDPASGTLFQVTLPRGKSALVLL